MQKTVITHADLANEMPSLQGQKVLIIGDMVLDHYVVGEVGRISPEAPVPVVLVESERHILGGAGNVAKNVKTLGGEPILVGVCGRDGDGELMSRLLRDSNITARMVVDTQRPTTRKTRIVAQNQQVVRVDLEKSHSMADNVLDQLFDFVSAELGDCPVIILSDYGKGLITEEFMTRLWKEVDKQDMRPKVFVDPKTRNFHLYKGVDILTPNTKEACEGAGMPIEDGAGVVRAGLKIFRNLHCKSLLITLGPDGMALFKTPEDVVQLPTAAQTVFDVTGAGDTVIATLALATAAGFDQLSACALANAAAGVVVAEVGTASVTFAGLQKALLNASDLEVTTLLGSGVAHG